MAQFCAWFIYRTKEKHQGLQEWKSKVLVLAMSWEWNWSCCSGSGRGRRAGFSSGAHRTQVQHWTCFGSALNPIAALSPQSWPRCCSGKLCKRTVQRKIGICKSQKHLNSNGISKAQRNLCSSLRLNFWVFWELHWGSNTHMRQHSTKTKGFLENIPSGMFPAAFLLLSTALPRTWRALTPSATGKGQGQTAGTVLRHKHCPGNHSSLFCLLPVNLCFSFLLLLRLLPRQLPLKILGFQGCHTPWISTLSLEY